ncbi:MAG TPA: MOSC domain-containing protein [Actinomycetota bacterium]|jgi:MOSC domain-containing protein YiiM
MSWHGTVEGIYLASNAAEPLVEIDKVKLVVGLGLEGDRYFHKRGTFSKKPKPGREVTLIEAEAIEAVQTNYGLDVTPADARRNIVTRGVPLNHLVGRRFTVGDATLIGIRLCEPCTHLTKLVSGDFRKALVHRGGLRAEVLEGAEIHRGDVLRPTDPHEPAALRTGSGVIP